ncbi:MAG: ABC-three component system protein, partial [Angustibacter sp.]
AGISVGLLSRELGAVTGRDLVLQVTDIVDQLKSDNLPVDPLVMQRYDESIRDVYQDRPFVQQLIWIALDNTRLWKAIRDYHRAYSQRSFWMRHQLLAEPELDRFAFRLYDEWEQVFDRGIADMTRTGRNNVEIVGQEILEALASESRARVRERFDEPWFNRGMLHALADGELGQRIGWHPDFEAKLEAILTNV